MGWEPERNRNSLSPHGLKKAEGHAAPGGVHDVNSVGCPPMPDGILGAPLNADPHGRGFKMPVHIAPEARRPRDEPAATTVPHNPSPHVYNPASQVQQKNTYAQRGDTAAHERRESAAERRREGE
jgi:hypothetical protein